MNTLDGGSWSSISVERRDSKRYNLLHSATVYRADGKQVGAVVRDVSEGGLLFFADFVAPVGEQLRIIVDGNPRAMRVTGSVVRLEYDSACNTVGIAICIEDSFLSSIEDVLMSSATFKEFQPLAQRQQLFAAALPLLI